MNFMPATVEGDAVRLPMASVRLTQDVRERVGRDGARSLIAGIRPENFEDASLVSEGRERGATFRARVEVLESLGSELYAHFSVEPGEAIQSQELQELAEDAGAAEVPSAGGEGHTVARLDPDSRIQEGQEAELWVDASRIQLFEPESGRSLTASR
jgi:multiple sugar transport system ATP-binding protein